MIIICDRDHEVTVPGILTADRTMRRRTDTVSDEAATSATTGSDEGNADDKGDEDDGDDTDTDAVLSAAPAVAIVVEEGGVALSA